MLCTVEVLSLLQTGLNLTTDQVSHMIRGAARRVEPHSSRWVAQVKALCCPACCFARLLSCYFFFLSRDNGL